MVAFAITCFNSLPCGLSPLGHLVSWSLGADGKLDIWQRKMTDFFSTLDLGKEIDHDAQALKNTSLMIFPLSSPKLKGGKAIGHLNN